ncbi:MAG: hypothetical protein QOH58_2870 [Thermoleophilaceae bacterium]|jgi:predicted transcriptional regulator of viral defense system|nr:hypothetical protein [Thermoleophilaceae bacterium]
MAAEERIEHQIDVESSSRAWDAEIAALADAQHGVVARPQLLELGLGRGAIGRRVEAARLHVVHRGVYAVGRRRLTRMGVWMAAVLACGPDAVLSHRSAAALWGMRSGAPHCVEVSAPGRVGERDGIRARRRAIGPDERTIESGVPVTTVSRTLLDLAAVLRPHELERALEQAEALRLADPIPLAALVERHRGRRGLAALRSALEKGVRPTVTRSELERRFLTFAERAGLPRPNANAWLELAGEWIQVDCAWPEQRLIVELDSRSYHGTAAAFERDRRRDRRLLAAGWRVARVTDRALREDAPALSAQLRAALSAAAGRSA